jgi:hypothetical protein
VLLAAVGGLAMPVIAAGHDVDAPAARRALSLGIAAGTVSLGCAGVAAAALRAEQAVSWLLDAAGRGGWVRVAAASGAASVSGAALGAVHGAIGAFGLGGGPAFAARLVVVSGVWGAILGALAAWAARRAHIAGPRRDRWGPLRLAVAAGFSMVCISHWGELAIPVVAAAAAVLAATSARAAGALPPPRCAHPAGQGRGGRRP